jgi:hypothetical protein
MERIDQRAEVTPRTRKGATTRKEDSGSRLTRLFCTQEKTPEDLLTKPVEVTQVRRARVDRAASAWLELTAMS